MKKILSCLFVLGIIIAFKPKDKPTLYIIGDSTVRNTNKEYWGWGSLIGEYLDTTKINIANHAMAGRSTRTFVKEKRWAKVDSLLKPGDYLMIQFGHNEGSKPDTTKAGYRGVLRGIGQDSVNLVWPDGKPETVFTYGAYLRKFIRGAKAKGATPIVLSMIPRNQWDDKGNVKRADKDFGLWAKQIAEEEGVAFIDLNSISADKYQKLGPEKVKESFFPGDHTHTNKAGALVNAESVAEGLRRLNKHPLAQFLRK
ncbi:lipolytic protein G-D-S-L family [Pseudopedobacter saltans DSM 12145]|uniref:Lipolytic protein G-D-S-L family n=1 Tax=Pseudopedobacter saltans (strain ATCC 51119 / DSM 12145 / JCM 21818 / CCUG 39354 / LMG 10337 / NBRC 100064 / NCIMB 13643) TaxID=762903 RepID=F0S6D2_PSESL|nr:GDSL-type esterase/lipase family protein [Pseudopedobacter saltans]ADY54258.1 lipolytic protein G-D-S-L family [Pseudopedobacter saltans DSM 12145]